MNTRIDKAALGIWYRGQLALNAGESESATEFFKAITETHPDAQRYLALTYYDREELDDAIEAFEIAYNKGDLKALPWLEHAIREAQLSHPKAAFYTAELARLTAGGDKDVLLSLGNIKMINDQTDEALELWARTGTDYWIAVMNLVPYVVEDPDEKIQYILRDGQKAPEGEDAVNEFIIKLYWNFILQGVHEAAFTLAQFIATLGEEAAEKHYEKLMPSLWTAVLVGEPYSLDFYHLAALHNMVEHDLDEIHEQFVAYGMEDFEAENLKNYEETSGDTAPKSASLSGNWGTDHFYQRAQAAEAEGDQLTELTAWRDLENAGDKNGLHNFAISVAREIGVNISFMGVDGNTESAWAPFAAGIAQDEMRPGRDVADLDEIPAPISSKQSPFFARVIESLEYNHILYTVYDDKRIAIPYSSDSGVQTIWLHGADLDGLETCIVSTTIGLDENGGETGLTAAQQRTLKALFRNSELIFPNTMIDIGDVFRSISEELKPSPFAANILSEEIAYGRFFEFTDFIPSIDALIYAKPTLIAGYGISSELSGPHLDEAIRSSCQALIGVFDLYASMYESSREVLEILFPHTPLHQLLIESELIDLDAIRENPQTLSDYMNCVITSDDEEDAEPIIMAGAEAGITSLQVLAISNGVAEGNYDEAAKWAEKALAAGDKSRFLGDQLNNLGWGYKMENDRTQAMKYLKLSAEFGCANAMSTVTWTWLEEGRHQEARDFFDAHYFKIMTSLDSDEDFAQASNMRSNDALNRWALGANDSEVIAIWSDEKFQEGHTESAFYPILAKWRSGDRDGASSDLAKLPDYMLDELRATFEDYSDRTGWFKELSVDALELLNQSKPKKKGFFSRS